MCLTDQAASKNRWRSTHRAKEPMIRLFIALDLPDDVKQRLAGLGGGVPGARWIPPENLHLTLRFIGEVEEDRLDDLDGALGRLMVAPFALTLAGVDRFETAGKVRALWVGVARSEPLTLLQSKVDSALVRAGLPRDERRFTPHVTLARLKDAPSQRVGRFIQQRSLFRCGPVPIDRFHLFESQTKRNGAIYHRLKAYGLEGVEPGNSQDRVEATEDGRDTDWPVMVDTPGSDRRPR